MSETNLDKIIAKVQKLLALAGNNPNEAEALAAMERAHAILAEYNLSLADVKEGSQEDAVVNNDLVTESQIWSRPIYDACAKLYFCGYFFVWVRSHDPKIAWKAVGYRR